MQIFFSQFNLGNFFSSLSLLLLLWPSAGLPLVFLWFFGSRISCSCSGLPLAFLLSSSGFLAPGSLALALAFRWPSACLPLVLLPVLWYSSLGSYLSSALCLRSTHSAQVLRLLFQNVRAFCSYHDINFCLWPSAVSGNRRVRVSAVIAS